MTTPTTDVVVLPVLPLRNTVLFPSLFLPLAVGRPSSIAAVEAVLATEEKAVIIVAQRDAAEESPASLDSLYTIGTRAVIKKMARGEAGIEMLVQGLERVTLLQRRTKRAVSSRRRAVEPCLRPRMAVPRSRRCTAPCWNRRGACSN